MEGLSYEKTFKDRGSELQDFIGHSSWNSSWLRDKTRNGLV